MSEPFAPLYTKEKKAVLAEAQMMNTIEYRVDCQLLQHLHWDNALGCRFPIGKLEQVHGWESNMVRQFHDRWYFPANATLYVVGDFHADVPAVLQMIETAFGAAQVPEVEEGQLPRDRHAVRPPVRHAFGVNVGKAEEIRAELQAGAGGGGGGGAARCRRPRLVESVAPPRFSSQHKVLLLKKDKIQTVLFNKV